MIAYSDVYNAFTFVYHAMLQGPQYYLTNNSNDFILMIGVIHSMTPTPMATYTNIASTVMGIDADVLCY